MGLWDKLKGELIDVIEWLDQSNDTLVHRFERYGNEIKNGAKLIVRESQVAVFINEGELADVFPPGTYTLETQNLPILSTLKGWKYGFKSPFKAEVYFVSQKMFKNMKWGTPNAFYVRDKDFGRVSLRAFGTFTFKITDASKFIKEVSGTDGNFTADEVVEELRSLVITRFIDSVGKSNLSLLDYAANYKDLSDFCEKKLQEEFVMYGLEIVKFLISSINLPEELQKKLDMGTGMNMIGNMQQYQQMKMADAMENASNNPGGGQGGMENMYGMAIMSQMMNQQMGNQNQQNMNMGSMPPPPPIIQFFAVVNGAQQGPLNMDQIAQLTSQKAITPETMVWKQGMANWMQAKTVPELANLFMTVAPPPPPPPPMQ
jgi:membrane protease subunit (stomatin/prohibitin family)